jgi:hypothetical protein
MATEIDSYIKEGNFFLFNDTSRIITIKNTYLYNRKEKIIEY